MKEERGITLVALVITVIVMLILSAVTINLTLGERGIFSTATGAVEKQKIAEYLEKIELSRVEVSSYNMEKVTIDDLKAQILKDKIVIPPSEGTITKVDEEKLNMTTKEGYIFFIYGETAEYIGKDGEIPTPPEIDTMPPSISVGEQKMVTVNSIIDSEFIKRNNVIKDDKSEDDKIQIENIVIRKSTNEQTSNILDELDVYQVSFNAKDEAGNVSNTVTQTIITKPSNSITLSNIIPNSSFEESGINNWYNDFNIILGDDKANTGNYSLKNTVSKNQAFLRRNFGNIGTKGKDIFIKAYAFTDSESCQPLLYGFSVSDPTEWPNHEVNNGIDDGYGRYTYNNWGICSTMLTKEFTIYDNFLVQLAQANTNAVGTIWWDDILGIDLSAFGNTIPSKSWLDRMIPYFEGSKTFEW